MPAILSTRHCKLIINGHQFNGYSNDDPPVEFPDIDFLDYEFGKDGGLYGNDNGMQGGELLVKLAPGSESAKWCIRQLARRNRGERVLYSGSYGDVNLNYVTNMLGGRFKMCPPAVTPGKTFEATFVFKQYQPLYDGALFTPSPILSF